MGEKELIYDTIVGQSRELEVQKWTSGDCCLVVGLPSGESGQIDAAAVLPDPLYRAYEISAWPYISGKVVTFFGQPGQSGQPASRRGREAWIEFDSCSTPSDRCSAVSTLMEIAVGVGSLNFIYTSTSPVGAV